MVYVKMIWVKWGIEVREGKQGWVEEKVERVLIFMM